MTSEKRIKLLNDLLLKCSYRTQPKNTNPKSVFQPILNPGFGFGKMAGFTGALFFSKPGFQSLVPVIFERLTDSVLI